MANVKIMHIIAPRISQIIKSQMEGEGELQIKFVMILYIIWFESTNYKKIYLLQSFSVTSLKDRGKREYERLPLEV